MGTNNIKGTAIEYLKNLIEIPSLSTKEDEIAAFVHKSLPAIFKGKIERDGNSIIIKLGNINAPHRLLLCSHIDTVEAADGWTFDPFKANFKDGKIYGLGANDALASVVSMIFSASLIEDKLHDNVGITIALVECEEKGAQGFVRIEPKLFYTCAIFGEPTDNRIGTSMRGYMRLKLKGEGKACHAARPWEGRNAIKDLAHAIENISNLNLKDNSPWGAATIEPTIISGGKSDNQIPDTAEAILDIRPTPEINNENILKMLNDINCNYEIISNKRKPIFCSEESDIFKAAIKAHPKAQTYAFGGTCDMAFSTKPSIVVGPGKSERSHAANEYIEENELLDGILFYEKILTEYINLSKT